MDGKIHPALRPHLPGSHAFIYTFFAVVALLLPVILIIGQADDPVGMLARFPQGFLQALIAGVWVKTLFSWLALAMLLGIVNLHDHETLRSLRAASATLETATPCTGQLVVVTRKDQKSFAYLNIPENEEAVCRQMAVLFLHSAAILRKPGRFRFDGEIYATEDCLDPIVIITPEGTFVAKWAEEIFFQRWQTLALPPRVLPKCILAQVFNSTLLLVALSVFSAAMPVAGFLGIIHSLSISIFQCAFYLFGTLVTGAMSLTLFATLLHTVRQDRTIAHVLQHGIAGYATLLPSAPTRKRWWNPFYPPQISVLIHDGKRYISTIKSVLNPTNSFDEECACAVLFDPLQPERVMPIRDIQSRLDPKMDAEGNIITSRHQYVNMFFIGLIVSVFAFLGLFMWWMLLFQPSQINW